MVYTKFIYNFRFNNIVCEFVETFYDNNMYTIIIHSHVKSLFRVFLRYINDLRFVNSQCSIC